MKSPRSNIAKSIAASSAVALLTLSGAGAASLQAIGDLFSTGVDAGGTPLADGSADSHYNFSGVPAGENPPGPIAINSAHGFPIGPWLGDNATSSWLVPGPSHDGVSGDYTYRTTFTIPAGVDPTQVFIRGAGTSDNSTTDVRINGVSTGIGFVGNFGGFDPQFTIQSGFQVGLNTLEFTVNEAGGGPSGLRVELGGSHGLSGHSAITNLFNSGVDAGGAALADDAADSHWMITTAPTSSGPLAATSAGGFPIGPWLGDSPTSTWLVPTVDTNGLAGDYFYETTFDISGDASTASIFGRWAVDNEGVDILLNGVPTGNANPNGFAGWTDFSVAANEGDIFNVGSNTLTFRVNNAGQLADPPGPTGLRVEFLSSTVAPIPEPSSLGLCAIALLTVLRRRR
ncbi:MAG: hypothetical protein ACI8XO_003800 [Verrucomicrobiales bacterium]|jgi:hypothetical protein